MVNACIISLLEILKCISIRVNVCTPYEPGIKGRIGEQQKLSLQVRNEGFYELCLVGRT